MNTMLRSLWIMDFICEKVRDVGDESQMLHLKTKGTFLQSELM